MKKIVIILIAYINLISCSFDENVFPNPPDWIIGTWNGDGVDSNQTIFHTWDFTDNIIVEKQNDQKWEYFEKNGLMSYSDLSSENFYRMNIINPSGDEMLISFSLIKNDTLIINESKVILHKQD